MTDKSVFNFTPDEWAEIEPIARLERQGAAESASTPKSGCPMPSHTAILPSIGLLLGAIWEMSVQKTVVTPGK